MSSSEEIQVNDNEPLVETKLGCALLLSYEKDISSIMISLEVHEKTLNKEKAMTKFFILQHF
tara:strand:+ start:1325 stop:1510 length:186 start_codon:yes stop_codon:yes gene_type:complete